MITNSSMISVKNSGDNTIDPCSIFVSIHAIFVGINGFSPDISVRIANLLNLVVIISFENLRYGSPGFL